MQENKRVNCMLADLAVFFYFMAMLISNQFEGRIVSLIWYTALLYCCVIGFLLYHNKIKLEMFIFFCAMVATGALNIILIGTSSIRIQLLLVLMLCSSLSMLTDYVSEKTFLIAFLANAFLVTIKFLTVGIYGEVYKNSSTNYVSVFLMYPAVMYFTLMEKKKKRIPVILVILLWALSLFARGRGGIIAATVLFVGLLFVDYLRSRNNKKIIILLVGAMAVMIAAINIDKIIGMINASAFSEYFRDRGMKSNSRMGIMRDYISHAISGRKYFLFGADISTSVVGIDYGGNPHNTYISIHMYNGLLMLLVILGILAKKVVISVKTHQYVYTVCVFSMLVRAFTDSIFWPAYGTVALFFLLFFEIDETDLHRKTISII